MKHIWKKMKILALAAALLCLLPGTALADEASDRESRETQRNTQSENRGENGANDRSEQGTGTAPEVGPATEYTTEAPMPPEASGDDIQADKDRLEREETAAPPQGITDEEDLVAEGGSDYQETMDTTHTVHDGSSGSRGEDLNGNGIPDADEMAEDLNGNGIPDSQEEDYEHAGPTQDPGGAEDDDVELDMELDNAGNPLDDLTIGGQLGDSQGDRAWNAGQMNQIQSPVDMVYHTQIRGAQSTLPADTSVRVTPLHEDPAYQVKMASIWKVLESQNVRIFDIQLQDGQGNDVHQLGDSVQVRMDVPDDYEVAEDMTVVVYHMSDNGQMEACQTVYNDDDPENRYVVFLTDHFSVYLFAEITPEKAQQVMPGIPMELPEDTAADMGQTSEGGMMTMLLGAAAIVVMAGVAVAVIKRQKA